MSRPDDRPHAMGGLPSDGTDQMSAEVVAEPGDVVAERQTLADNRDPDRPYRVGLWVFVVGVLALAGFFVAIPARVYDLDFSGRVIPRQRRIDLIELWRIQARNLPEFGGDRFVQAIFISSAILVLIGAAYLVWIAMVEVRPPAGAVPGGASERDEGLGSENSS